MDFVRWGLNPWGQSILVHVSWTLFWASLFAGLMFLVAHGSYMLLSAHRKRPEAETDKLDETKLDISFGSQIRSYVMQPYRIIKDHRTKFEVGDVDRVMDGDLDPFIHSYFMAKKTKGRLEIQPDEDGEAA